MAMEPVPYLVGGGFEHSAEVMRSALAASTGGREGIVTPGDFKVRPLAVPGTGVRVAAGNGLILNTYTGGAAQSYACRAGAQSELPIEATGSSGVRRDLIIARIDDPTYQGGAFDPETFVASRFEVIRGVPANTTSVKSLNLGYPAIELARIDIPRSTGTITADMITDLRSMAMPRSLRRLEVHPMVGDDGIQRITNTTSDGQYWPTSGTTWWWFDVPQWATHVRAIAQWGGVVIDGGGGTAHGRVWIRFGSINDPQAVNMQTTGWNTPRRVSNDYTRESWISGDQRRIPTHLRGQNIPINLRARILSSESNQARPYLDASSVVSLDVEFYETAV